MREEEDERQVAATFGRDRSRHVRRAPSPPRRTLATSSTATSAGRSTWSPARSSRSRSSSAKRRSRTARCSTSTGRSNRGSSRRARRRTRRRSGSSCGYLIGSPASPTRSKEREQKDQKVRAVVGVPAETLRVNRQHLRNAVKGLADSLMIVSEPFAVAYGLDALLHTMIIDIGAGHHRLLRDERPLSDRGGPAHADQRRRLGRRAARDADRRAPSRCQFSIHMVRDWKEQHGFVGEPKEKVVVTAPVHGKATPGRHHRRDAPRLREPDRPFHRDHARPARRGSTPSTRSGFATTSSWPAAARASAAWPRRSKRRSPTSAAARSPRSTIPSTPAPTVACRSPSTRTSPIGRKCPLEV